MEWWVWLIAAGGAAVFMVVFLVVNGCQQVRNHYLVALAVLSLAILLTCLMATASFVPESALWGIPLLFFVLWFALFLIAEGVFIVFFFRPTSGLRLFLNNIHSTYKTNPLKGWGGATFAEYSGLIGLLVAVGVYRVFETEQPSYWWAAQIAAIVSVISTAAWVQRYILEGPEKEKENHPDPSFATRDRSEGDYFKKTFPTLLNGFAAALTVLSICVPVAGNNLARDTAIGGWSGIFVLWILVFLNWLLIALIPTLKRVLSWPVWGTRLGTSVRIWGNRENLRKTFLYPTVAFAGLSLIFMLIWSVAPNAVWPDGWGVAFGIIPAIFYIVSVIWKAVVDGYDAQGSLWLVYLFRDILLCVAGSLIVVAQIISAAGGEGTMREGDFANTYLVFLIFMIGISLFNLVTAAYQWSVHPPYAPHIGQRVAFYENLGRQQ